MLEQISIDELVPGMYVEKVIEQTGKLKIKTEGYVRSDKTISQLRRSGILTLEIDPSKTLQAQKAEEEKAVSETEEPKQADAYDPTEKTASLSSELNKASRLYSEALSYQEKVFQDIAEGRALNPEPAKDIASSFIDSIFRNQDALACMTQIREKDSYLLEHSVNVSILMSILAKHLHMDKDVIHELATGALLHDIGKIKVPDAILNKPGKLTDEEFRVMRSHVTHSAAILKKAPGVSRIAFDVAANHHERLDGNGYPRGLSATQLSMYARMISIVDAYDAMTANRCYKEGLNTIIAFRILKKDSNVHFDAHLVDKFIQALGPHPVGSVVKLDSGKLAFVSETNFEFPLQPMVKTFYHTKLNQYTELKDIDLSNKRTRDQIIENVRPEDYKIDLNRFFKAKIL